MSTELFRKSALETLSSPEQLDQMMKVTRPRSWIALSAMALVLFGAILWSVFGSLPTSVGGSGIIIYEGGVYNIVANGSGTLSGLPNFRAGDKIKKGQTLGHLTQPVLEHQIEAAKTALQEERITVAEERNAQLSVIHAKEEQLSSLKSTEQQQAELLRDGLITRQRYEETRQAIYATQNEIDTGRQKEVLGNVRISQAEEHLNELQLQHQLASNIVSMQDGNFVEAIAMNSDAIKDGQPILSIEVPQGTLKAIVYLPPGSIRKLVQPGMTAQISPATSKKERYGYLLGKVLTVSQYPATETGMMSVFNNAALVHDLSSGGQPLAVMVELIPDPKTRSGYAWSSKAGAGVEVSSGTLCSGSFVVENKRPISLLIPLLKESIGL